MDCALSRIRAGKSVSHVCRVLRLARSNVCRLLHRAADWQDGRHCRQQRRDLISDQDLLERIKAVLGKFPCFGYKRIRVLPTVACQAEESAMSCANLYTELSNHPSLSRGDVPP